MTTPRMNVEPCRLTGDLVVLEPLDMSHVPELANMAQHDEIWTYLDEPTPQAEQPVSAMVAEALDEQEQGVRLPFAVVERKEGRTVGTVSYIDIQRAHYGVEIGWAWIAPQYWQQGIAREAAYLLMRHAFDTLGAVRVAFKTDSRNVRSQRAITALVATQEGVFRNHRILRDGVLRHSIYYSVIREEWPTVRAALESSQ
jgi:RimJ/RimL family protein N-acetyltransferase